MIMRSLFWVGKAVTVAGLCVLSAALFAVAHRFTFTWGRLVVAVYPYARLAPALFLSGGAVLVVGIVLWGYAFRNHR